MDRAEQARMRDVPHPHAVPRHTAVCADEARRATAARKLDAIRHRERRVPSQAHDVPEIDGWLRVVLRAAVLTRVDLAAASTRLARGARVSWDELSLQAGQLALADPDPPQARRGCLAPIGRADTKATFAISQTTR